MHQRHLWQCVWGIVLVAGAGLSAEAQGVYHNQRLFVVPAPGKVVIDGDLKDWDRSSEIYTYVTEATAEFQSARTAMMYDAEALYISGRVADPSPLLNKADPAVNPDFGWDGDAFQFRLCLDPALGYPLKIGGYDRTPSEMLAHLTLWWHTDSKKPVLHLKYGMDFHDAHGYHKGVVPADKFQAAYVPWPDGKGYTFEYRIPWATLGAPRPLKGGDLCAAAIQIQWSDQTGQHSYGGGWAVDLLAHAGFSYQSTACWGKAIFAEKGRLPKELTQEGLPPVRPLPLKFTFELPKEQVTSITLIDAKGDRVRNLMAAQSRPASSLIPHLRSIAWNRSPLERHNCLSRGKTFSWRAFRSAFRSLKVELTKRRIVRLGWAILTSSWTRRRSAHPGVPKPACDWGKAGRVPALLATPAPA